MLAAFAFCICINEKLRLLIDFIVYGLGLLPKPLQV